MEKDSEILLNRFPREIWMKLFKKFVELKRYDDVENSINSSRFFHTLNNIEKTTLLFRNVFKVLLSKYEKAAGKEYRESEHQQMQAGIFRRKIISPEKAFILKMRLICKSWCTSVNNHYIQLNDHYEMEHDHRPVSRGLQDCSDWNAVFRKTEDAEKDDKKVWFGERFTRLEYQIASKFLKHYEHTHYKEGSSENPFIGRSISISGNSPGNTDPHPLLQDLLIQQDDEFRNAITAILEKYGKYIRFCDINIRDKFKTRVEYYRQIRLWLVLMPNLKVLKFTYQIRMYDKYPTPKMLNRLNFEIAENPLPKFENLMFLRTRMIPAPIFNELVKNNCGTLKMFEVSRNRRQVGYDIYTVKFPYLKHLSTQIVTVDELEMMKNMLATLNLEKLYLSISPQVSLANWTTIFRLTKTKWGDTLTNLVIDLSKVNRNVEIKKLLRNLSSDEFQLELPNVKRFKLIIHNRTSIDFILPMKETLEIFEFFNLFGRPRLLEDEENEIMNHAQIIKIVGFEGRLYESNIWELFPNLARIQVQNEHIPLLSWKSIDNVYTRDKWQKRRQN